MPYYFIKNLQGDVITIVDKDAQPVARYSYDAWGVPTVTLDTSDCQIADINPFRYRGYYYDKEIGLYYLQSRYYDAGIGRFVNADNAEIIKIESTVDATNIFAYCYNNPINQTDTTGFWSLRVRRSTLSLAIDVTLSLVSGWAKYAYDLIGTGLRAIFKRKGKRYFMDVLSGTVPRIISWAGRYLTAIRKVLWRIGFIVLSHVIGAIVTIFQKCINAFINNSKLNDKSKSFGKEALDIIFCLFSTGGIVALFLDYITDGQLDGFIKIH